MMYERKSRLSTAKQYKLIELFVAGATARMAAKITGVQVHTATRFFMGLRRLIASHQPTRILSGEVEVDESFYGGARKGKRGRGAAGKIIGFGLLERGGEVVVCIVPNTLTETLMPIIEEIVAPDSIVYTDKLQSYNALDVSDFHHQRINHSEEFVSRRNRRNHINGIENFWSQSKRHMRKFNGIKPDNFHWFLKECEWRFNGGDPKMLLKSLKHWYKQVKH